MCQDNEAHLFEAKTQGSQPGADGLQAAAAAGVNKHYAAAGSQHGNACSQCPHLINAVGNCNRSEKGNIRHCPLTLLAGRGTAKGEGALLGRL